MFNLIAHSLIGFNDTHIINKTLKTNEKIDYQISSFLQLPVDFNADIAGIKLKNH